MRTLFLALLLALALGCQSTPRTFQPQPISLYASFLAPPQSVAVPTGDLTMVAAAVAATAFTVELRWTHAMPSDVNSYHAHFGILSGVYDQALEVDMGNPTEVGGVFTALIPNVEPPIYVALTAQNRGLVSPFSNEVYLAVPDAPIQVQFKAAGATLAALMAIKRE